MTMAVDQTVDDGGGDNLVSEDLTPVREATIRGKGNGRRLLVATADDLKDPVR